MRRYRTRLGLQFGNESIAARRRNVGITDFLILLGNWASRAVVTSVVT